MNKLELNWIGKYDVQNSPRPEPRILIENPQYSYGDVSGGNMLIHGDNLLALKSLELEYAGKIRCIYIEIIITNLVQFTNSMDLLFRGCACA